MDLATQVGVAVASAVTGILLGALMIALALLYRRHKVNPKLRRKHSLRDVTAKRTRVIEKDPEVADYDTTIGTHNYFKHFSWKRTKATEDIPPDYDISADDLGKQQCDFELLSLDRFQPARDLGQNSCDLSEQSHDSDPRSVETELKSISNPSNWFENASKYVHETEICHVERRSRIPRPVLNSRGSELSGDIGSVYDSIYHNI